MSQSSNNNDPSSGKPQVKRFVRKKPANDKALGLLSALKPKSPKEIGVAIILLLVALSVGIGLVERLAAGLGLTGKSAQMEQARQEYDAEIKEIRESRVSTSKEPAPAQELTKQWNEGGTLHKAGALEWQQATYANKLATCADIVSKFWMDGIFVPELQEATKTMDHIRVLSEKLVEEMDKAMAPLPDAEQNRQTYANQKVSEMAILTMALLGWISG